MRSFLLVPEALVAGTALLLLVVGALGGFPRPWRSRLPAIVAVVFVAAFVVELWAGGTLATLFGGGFIQDRFALFAKDYAKALASAKAAETVRPAELWIKANRAHAEMFSGDAEAARSGYLAHRGKALSPSVTWEQSTLGDFALFRKAGLTHPLMEEIENRFKS